MKSISLTISGGRFTTMSSRTGKFPACVIERFSAEEIRVSRTRPDSGPGSDHFHFSVGYEILSTGGIWASTTAGATMNVKVDDQPLKRIDEGTSDEEVHSWFTTATDSSAVTE